MTTIKATCPTCGEVSLTPDDLELRVDTADMQRSYYRFGCPRCAADVRKPADDRVARLLVSGGVIAQPIAPPPPTLAERFDHPPLTRDHLLELHEAMQADDWLERLTGAS